MSHTIFPLNGELEKKWYCSKYVYFALEAGSANEIEAVETMTTLGLKTIAPQNVWDSTVQILQVGYKE